MVTAGISFQRQVDLLTSLFHYRFSVEPVRAELKTHTKRLSELEQRRNAVMHSSWLRRSADLTQATRFKITTDRKKGLAQAKEVLTPTELDRIADGFCDVLYDFSGFMIPLVSGLQHLGCSPERVSCPPNMNENPSVP
jgi:hypothetical protein